DVRGIIKHRVGASRKAETSQSLSAAMRAAHGRYFAASHPSSALLRAVEPLAGVAQLTRPAATPLYRARRSRHAGAALSSLVKLRTRSVQDRSSLPAPAQDAPAVYLETFGCQMNVADTGVIAGRLAARGYRRVDDPARA